MHVACNIRPAIYTFMSPESSLTRNSRLRDTTGTGLGFCCVMPCNSTPRNSCSSPQRSQRHLCTLLYECERFTPWCGLGGEACMPICRQSPTSPNKGSGIPTLHMDETQACARSGSLLRPCSLLLKEQLQQSSSSFCASMLLPLPASRLALLRFLILIIAAVCCVTAVLLRRLAAG